MPTPETDLNDAITMLVMRLGFAEVKPIVTEMTPEETRPIFGLGVQTTTLCPDPHCGGFHEEHLALMMPLPGAAGLHTLLLAFRDSLASDQQAAYDAEVQRGQQAARDTRLTLLDAARRLRSGEQ